MIGDPHQLPPIVSMSEQTEERIHQDLNVHLPKQLHFTNHNSLFSISDYLSKSLSFFPIIIVVHPLLVLW